MARFSPDFCHCGKSHLNYIKLTHSLHVVYLLLLTSEFIREKEMVEESGSNWCDDYSEEGEDDLQVEEYDITSTPNDFNVVTLYNFVKGKAVRIPAFQRNFVWDLARASKLIESLIRGLPIPQIFLYEQKRNEFLVIDGQQRLMSIYYFMEKRFPKKDKRVKLSSIFEKEGSIPDDILHNDDYFQPFNLRLPESLPRYKNKFKGLNYSTLGEDDKDYKSRFDFRPIRCIVVKQNSPSDDDSSMYEIFNRLNTGGTNLHPQEIRASMYHSNFYQTLYNINQKQNWRKLIGKDEENLHMKDIEILLRGFAFLIDGENYAPSMVKFLNQFSKKCRKNSDEKNTYIQKLFDSFLCACSDLPEDIFRKNNRFNLALYEAVFVATCKKAFSNKVFLNGKVEDSQVQDLEENEKFKSAISHATTQKLNVKKRLEISGEIISAL